MKTAISVPDEVFHEADQLAHRLKKSRSELFSEAMREFLYRHSSDAVTEAINKVVDQVGVEVDPFVKAVGERALRKVEW